MTKASRLSRPDFVLATLAVLDENSALSPVQAQKLFFLLDKEIPHLISGPRFAFAPYDYGPFDADVYRDLELLSDNGFVEILPGGARRLYRLTANGRSRGCELSRLLGKAAADYTKTAGEFVLRLSFKQLVASIYKAYPEMKANSVFRG